MKGIVVGTLLLWTNAHLILGNKQDYPLLEPIDWNTMSEHVAQSEVIDNEQAELAKRIFLGEDAAVRQASIPVEAWHPPQTDEAYTGLLDESSTISTAPTNKWGFDEDCHVVCKKLLCFGWGPPPAEMCKRGEYKHRCCIHYRPTKLEATSNQFGRNLHPSEVSETKPNSGVSTNHTPVPFEYPPFIQFLLASTTTEKPTTVSEPTPKVPSIHSKFKKFTPTVKPEIRAATTTENVPTYHLTTSTEPVEQQHLAQTHKHINNLKHQNGKLSLNKSSLQHSKKKAASKPNSKLHKRTKSRKSKRLSKKPIKRSQLTKNIAVKKTNASSSKNSHAPTKTKPVPTTYKPHLRSKNDLKTAIKIESISKEKIQHDAHPTSKAKHMPTTTKSHSSTKPKHSSPTKKPHVTGKPKHNTNTKTFHSTSKPNSTSESKSHTTTKPKLAKSTTKPHSTVKPKHTSTTAITEKPHSICSNLTKRIDRCKMHPRCEFNCASKTCVSTTHKGAKHSKAEICKNYYCTLDICNCRGCDLAFNVNTGLCEIPKNLCQKLKFGKEDCLRPNQNYAYAGAICKSGKKAQNNCHVEQTILAVNLGTKGTGQIWKDSRNVSHLSDEGIPYEDKYRSKKKWTWVPKHKLDVKPQDKIFYETTVHGDSKAGGNKTCLTYKVKVWQNGKYELVVRLADPVQGNAKSRMFNILVNGLRVIAEVDIASVSKGQSSIAEIFLNFAVSKSGTIVSIPGLKDSKIVDGYVDLSFCYGSCLKESEFQEYSVAAFSVVKFVNIKDEESKKCGSYNGNVCTSRKYGCQYNLVNRDAVQLKNCTKTWFTKADCIRKNAYYLDGGILCYNKDTSGGNCHISDTLTAINMNGDRFGPDSRGIWYRSQREVPPIDHYKTVRVKKTDKVIGVAKQDRDLYLNYIYGDTGGNSTAKNNCVYWDIPIATDGLYEISIKTADFYFEHFGRRTFNVKINNEFVLREVDLLGLAPKGTGIDIIIHFEIMKHGSAIHIRGFPVRNFKEKLKLEFCSGGCKTESRNWMLGAFYVIKFEGENRHLLGL